MNWNHIEALFLRDTLYRSKSGDQDLLSDGCIAVAIPAEFMNGVGKDLPSMKRLWEPNVGVAVSPLAAGACSGEGKYIIRKIGSYQVAERFVRCMGDSVTWSVGKAHRGEPPLMVHRDGVLIALVMPVKCEEDRPAIPEPTDEQVFSPFACAENGRYLQSDADLMRELKKAENERFNAQCRMDEARQEVEELQQEIESLSATVASRKSANSSQAKTA